MLNSILEVLKTTSFLEKALLLLLGAVLTGIIVPIVKYRMDENRFRQQKTFEAEVARQAEIVRARVQFLRDFVDPVWQFQLLALQVTFDIDSEEKLKAVYANYDDNSWQHLKRIRAIVGGARWFTSESTYQLLTEFVDGWLLGEVDNKLMQEMKKGKKGDWNRFNRWLYSESRRKTDDLLVALADDFGLTPENAARGVFAVPSRETATRGKGLK